MHVIPARGGRGWAVCWQRSVTERFDGSLPNRCEHCRYSRIGTRRERLSPRASCWHVQHRGTYDRHSQWAGLGRMIRPGFDGGSVSRNMRAWREETVRDGERIEVPDGAT